MLFAATSFFLAAVGITALFALKSWEVRNGRVFAPAIRMKMDRHALQAKELLVAARVDLAKLPPAVLRLGRFLLREIALGLAILARLSERKLHKLADFVSHKHRFEKRETRSEFLKRVSEHKNGVGPDLIE